MNIPSVLAKNFSAIFADVSYLLAPDILSTFLNSFSTSFPTALSPPTIIASFILFLAKKSLTSFETLFPFARSTGIPSFEAYGAIDTASG